jgi:hypothetical protein
MLVLPDTGIDQNLDESRAEWNATLLKMHLFKNDVDPALTSVLADFLESDFPGYVAQDIAVWGVPVVVAHVARMQAAALTWLQTGAGVQDVYGYYVTDAAGTLLRWAERDPAAPVPMVGAGSIYSVLPAYTDQSLGT